MRSDGVLARPLAALKKRAPGVHRFLTAERGGSRLAREILSVVLLVGLLLGGLWLYTGQSGASPLVVVESGSMMHCANGIDRGPHTGTVCESSGIGRLGTIDPGDLILVKDVDGATDVSTLADGGRSRYGKAGDVIVYRPRGSAEATPIIHRALFWMEVHPDGNISIPAAGIERAARIDPAVLETLGVHHVDAQGAESPSGFLTNLREDCPGQAGFVTRGDNNHHIDTGLGSASIAGGCLVQEEWLVGKARGEIPWIGVLKLFFTDRFHYDQTPTDIKRFALATVVLILAGPFVVDLTVHKLRQARRRRGGGGPDGADGVRDDAAAGGAEDPHGGPGGMAPGPDGTGAEARGGVASDRQGSRPRHPRSR